MNRLKSSFQTMLAGAYLLVAAPLLSSCVGQAERAFPWEEEEHPAESVHTEGGRAFLMLDFTATWCTNCPAMYDAVKMTAGKLDIIPVCVHYADEFDCEDSRSLVREFGISAYPTVVVDFNDGLRTSTSSDVILQMLCEESMKDSPADVGIELKSSIEAGAMEVEASLSFETEGSFIIGAMLLENNLAAPQTGGGDNYIHNHVLRRIIYNEPVPASRGETVKRKIRIDSGPDQSAGDLEVVLYVTSGGRACNSAVISL